MDAIVKRTYQMRRSMTEEMESHRRRVSTNSASSRESSTSSLQEFGTPPLTESVSPVQVPTSVYNRRRRASMQDALDHTKINASLYQFDRPELRKQESVSSIQEDSQQGSIHFSLMYDPEQSLLTVRLIQATDLVPRDFSGTCDPYCRLRLLPNQRIQLQSKVKRKTRSPEFEEEFIFDVAQADIASRTLEILVFDFDQYSRDECMGQVLMSLPQLELGSQPVVLWRSIVPYEDQKQMKQADLGEIMFSLAYLPSAERLTVVIMKARNLKADDTKPGTSSKSFNPFIRVTMTSGGKKLKKKKTSAKRTNNPVWNEAIVLSISKEAVKSVQVELVVYNDSLLGNSEFLGKVLIGPNSSEEELSHWNDVINSKSALARWHYLVNEDS